jgi:hypothetical protein
MSQKKKKQVIRKQKKRSGEMFSEIWSGPRMKEFPIASIYYAAQIK